MVLEKWLVRIPTNRIVTHVGANGLRSVLPDERAHAQYELRDCGDGWLELSPTDNPQLVFRLPESDVVQYFASKQLKRVDGLAWPG
jgi:hypothetical protein